MSCTPIDRCYCEFCVEERMMWNKFGFIKKCGIFSDLQSWSKNKKRVKIRFIVDALANSLHEL